DAARRKTRSRAARREGIAMASGLRGRVAASGPLRPQVLPHLQGSRQRVPLHGPGEREVEGVAVALVVSTRQAHLGAVDAARQVARYEIALVGAFDPIALLAQEEVVG